MPLYEYECESCKNRFEKIVQYSDPPIDTCPKCGKGPIRKLFSSPAIQFKGSGWYITDYAKKSSTDAGQPGGSSNSSEKSDKSESSSKSDKGESSAKPDKSEATSKSDKSESTSKSDTGTSTSSTKSPKTE
jgi:putative FmdB family regulatory protein